MTALTHILKTVFTVLLISFVSNLNGQVTILLNEQPVRVILDGTEIVKITDDKAGMFYDEFLTKSQNKNHVVQAKEQSLEVSNIRMRSVQEIEDKSVNNQ